MHIYSIYNKACGILIMEYLGAMNSDIIVSHPSIFEPSFVHQVFGNLDISSKTKSDYTYRMSRFQGFVVSQAEMNRNTLLEYKRHLAADSSISVTTKCKYLIVAKVFVQQLYRLGILKVDISTGVKSFKLSGGFKTNGLTDEEVSRIMAGLNEMRDTRLKTIISLKMFSGLRDIEIVRLTVENINLTDGLITIHGKGRDGEEKFPIVPQVVQVLREYLTTTGKRSGTLFTSQSKRNYGKHLTTKTVWLIVRDFLDSLGINRNPHQMRSFFTTELVKKMDNLFDVILFTRHKNIQTLQNYFNQIGQSRVIPRYEKVFSNFVVN